MFDRAVLLGFDLTPRGDRRLPSMENTTATMTVAATVASLQEPPVGLTLQPLDPDQLAQVRRDPTDAFGNTVEEFSSDGGEQLRCCLRLADVGERLWVVGHAPLTVTSATCCTSGSSSG